ncbi:MAG: SDR family oxidoreductase [Gammaproteobacteria bacterium]|nr:SDR family oxidoreductase [Gammaproteobacteria bacterium]
MARLAGKRVVVTGSSRGLGRAFAMEMAAEGAKVVINGTDAQALAEVEGAISKAGGDVVAVRGSVAEESVCQSLVDTCVEAFGGIDIMVNNAGIVRDRTLLKMTMQEWDEVIAVHLRGAFGCTRAAATAMREAGGGHIVQIISASGLAGGFGQANYAAAKAGMMGLLRTCVLELSRFGIRNNAFWPIAETDMTQVVFERARAQADDKGEQAPDPVQLGFGKPEEVAQGLIWLTSEDAQRFDGQCMTCNGRKVALWTHPEERYVKFSEQALSVEAISKHFAAATPLPINRPQRQPD